MEKSGGGGSRDLQVQGQFSCQLLALKESLQQSLNLHTMAIEIVCFCKGTVSQDCTGQEGKEGPSWTHHCVAVLVNLSSPSKTLWPHCTDKNTEVQGRGDIYSVTLSRGALDSDPALTLFLSLLAGHPLHEPSVFMSCVVGVINSGTSQISIPLWLLSHLEQNPKCYEH